MAMVWLLLRNKNDVGLGNMGERFYAGGKGKFGEEELGMIDESGSGEPWVDED